jgi:hypothetical protein
VDGRFLASRSKTETVSSKMTMALIWFERVDANLN